jgi:sulfite exporter TauE/SafE
MNSLVVAASLMGLFGGAHCVTMCGGAASLVCGGPSRGTPYVIAYNLGRIAGYTSLGLLVGALGSIDLGPSFDFVRFGLRALAALCMLTVGLHLVGLPSYVRALESVGAPVWRHVSPMAKRLFPLRSPWHAALAGTLWALMPCGLLYGALALAASSSSTTEGALTMAAFGLGTAPVMLTVGMLARQVSKALARAWVRRAAGAVVLAFGLWSTAALAGQLGVGPRGPGHACCPQTR